MRLDLGAPFVQWDRPSNAFAHDADADSRPDKTTGALWDLQFCSSAEESAILPALSCKFYNFWKIEQNFH